MFSANKQQWSRETFAHANLGDSHRTDRLIKIVASLANNTGKSLVQSSKSPGDIEAAYRFTRNPAIKA